MSWIIRRGEQEFSCADLEELQIFANEGRIWPHDLLLDPRSQKWMHPEDIIEISESTKSIKMKAFFKKSSLFKSYRTEGFITFSKLNLNFSAEKLKFNVFIQIMIIIIFVFIGMILFEIFKDSGISLNMYLVGSITIGWGITRKTTKIECDVKLSEIIQIEMNEIANEFLICTPSVRMPFSVLPDDFKKLSSMLFGIVEKNNPINPNPLLNSPSARIV